MTNNIKTQFSTENKKFIRNSWNKPLIKFLTEKVKEKLIYVGLPSPQADDINEWLEHIKSVIAFQCRDYGKPSNPNQNREQILELEDFLRQLERQGKINDYVVYDGYLEEVVLKRYDNSPNEIGFKTDKFITLYNLDFCNDIASPIEYIDKDGNAQKAYKFNAIQRLLEIQKELSRISNKFIFLLTVHCSYKGKELQNFINNPPDESIKKYLKQYSKLKGNQKNAEIVRLFVCYNIQKYFGANSFSYYTLPIIKYKGIKDTQLLHFVTLGIHSTPTAEGVANFQSLEDMLNRQFITIESNQFENEFILEGEQSIDRIGEPVWLFQNSDTFKKLWK
ncbi:MAG: hypothetical protein FWC26_15100 [Fibromonadales bacterium]|nr:hypothetical protein [Fibromonadales bacterium]